MVICGMFRVYAPKLQNPCGGVQWYLYNGQWTPVNCAGACGSLFRPVHVEHYKLLCIYHFFEPLLPVWEVMKIVFHSASFSPHCCSDAKAVLFLYVFALVCAGPYQLNQLNAMVQSLAKRCFHMTSLPKFWVKWSVRLQAYSCPTSTNAVCAF